MPSIWLLLVIASVLLLALVARGEWTAARFGGGASPAGSIGRSMKRFAADLPEAVPGGEEAVLLALNKGLTARFQHGPGRFTVRSNFVFRLAGIVKFNVNPKTGQFYSPEVCRAIRRSRGFHTRFSMDYLFLAAR